MKNHCKQRDCVKLSLNSKRNSPGKASKAKTEENCTWVFVPPQCPAFLQTLYCSNEVSNSALSEVKCLRVKPNSFHIYYLLSSFHLLHEIRIEMRNLWCFVVDFFVVKLYMLIVKNKSDNTKRYRMKGHTNNFTIQCWDFHTHTHTQLLFSRYF